jgi:hypothetical protein
MLQQTVMMAHNELSQDILNQASSWGFVCKSEPLGNWKILPSQKTARWELQQVEDRWLLVVGGVAQVNLHQAEAQVFLKRRCLSHLNRQAV